VPHLAFDLSVTPSPGAKVRFTNAVVRYFSHIMDTGTVHIAVSLRCPSPQDMCSAAPIRCTGPPSSTRTSAAGAVPSEMQSE